MESTFKHTRHHIPPRRQEGWITLSAISHYRHTADFPPFYRDRAEGIQMFYTVSGKGWLDCDGHRQSIAPRTLSCVDLERPHGFGAEPGSVWEHYWLIGHGVILKELYEQRCVKHNVFLPQHPDDCAAGFLSLYDLKETNTLHFNLEAMRTVLNLWSAVLSAEPLHAGKEEDCLSSLGKSLSHIRLHFAEETTVQTLADIAGYSRFHFTRLFKRHTGFTPSQYLIKTRMEKAKEWLSGSTLSLQEIAERTGFHSVHHFITTFGALEKRTPGQYRKDLHF